MILRSLHRYPVKSMLGEELTACEVSERGLAGDRAFAVLDRETGRIGSAKYPRRWQALLTLTGAAGGRVFGPDGGELDADGLSRLLGRPVELTATGPDGAVLERAVPEQVLADGADAEVASTFDELGRAAPPGTFFDFAPLHLVTGATLDRTAEAARYRPNLVLDADVEAFAENGWAGRELLIGDRVRLAVLLPTPRCAVPTLAHGALPRDPEALRIPARHNRVEPLPGLGPLPCVGAYARVVEGGTVRTGDRVTLR